MLNAKSCNLKYEENVNKIVYGFIKKILWQSLFLNLKFN